MTTHTFTLVLDRRPTDHEFDALFSVGADDASFGVEQGASVAQFDRVANSLTDAIVSAVQDVESVGLIVLRVIDEDLVTLADVAGRIGQSRESVRRYATGERGPGYFPPPVNPDREGTVFYRWSEVAPWIRHALGIDVPEVDPALVMANMVLQARQFRDRIEDMAKLSRLLLKESAQRLPDSSPGTHVMTESSGTRDEPFQRDSDSSEDSHKKPKSYTTRARFEVYRDGSGRFSFLLKSSNGKIIASGEGYNAKHDALRALESVRHSSPAASVVDRT